MRNLKLCVHGFRQFSQFFVLFPFLLLLFSFSIVTPPIVVLYLQHIPKKKIEKTPNENNPKSYSTQSAYFFPCHFWINQISGTNWSRWNHCRYDHEDKHKTDHFELSWGVREPKQRWNDVKSIIFSFCTFHFATFSAHSEKFQVFARVVRAVKRGFWCLSAWMTTTGQSWGPWEENMEIPQLHSKHWHTCV